jgi:hypothetical protein
MKKKDGRMIDILPHFSEEIPAELEAFVREHALIHSRYLFVQRRGPFQYGYCTHCRAEYMIKGETLKHNSFWQCEKCKSSVEVKSSGRGRSVLKDNCYVIWYGKSLINPNAITATGYLVERDYSGDYREVETSFKEITLYLFEPGRSVMMRRDHYSTGIFSNRRVHFTHDWIFPKKVSSIAFNHMKYKSCSRSVDSIYAAIKDTTFQYSTWGEYMKDNDLVEFFSLFAKYPCVEYLTKMGLGNIVAERLEGRNPYNAINWRGKTMEKILGMTKKEIKELRIAEIEEPTHELIATYKWFRDRGVRISFEQAKNYGSLITADYYKTPLNQILTLTSLEKVVRYMENQLKKEPKRHSRGTGFISTWRDYVNECAELGMDLALENVLFPNSLYAEHQKNIRKVKIKNDAAVNEKIICRVKLLKKYCFSHSGLTLRPAGSSIELFDEGKALSHCVGQYAARYAEGGTNLFFIRKETEPDTSFFTLEVADKSGAIIQCRGKNNCGMTKEVRAFLDQFIARKLLTSKRTRIDTTGIQPANRQEAVV